MGEKKYEVIDDLGHVISSGMNLNIALLLMKAYCEEYYLERAKLTLKEMDMPQQKEDISC